MLLAQHRPPDPIPLAVALGVEVRQDASMTPAEITAALPNGFHVTDRASTA